MQADKLEVGIYGVEDLSARKTIALTGDNILGEPSHFAWVKDEIRDITFLANHSLTMVTKVPKRHTRVALLLDPVDDTFYYTAFRMEEDFDFILSPSKAWIKKAKSPKWLYYPMGGSSIKPDNWGIGEKTKNISILARNASRGKMSFGDQFKADIRRKADVFGIDIHGLSPSESAIDSLQDYRFSIVVEDIREEGYFTRRLIDCLSQGTIPIYWGDPSIYDTFQPNGLLPFSNMDELVNILINDVSESNYRASFAAIMGNISLCNRYYCAEDWIYTNYRHVIFGDDDLPEDATF